ncbi:MAG: outer membrane beta-barrel protein [Azoarcus sp.]|jgi:outer membrane protein|nr:outer membrane beta-barrel protein [Azoarcus sp.]
MRTQKLAAILVATAIALPGAAFAHERGSLIVRGGVMYYDLDSDSSKVKHNGASIPNSKATIDSGGQVFNLSATWMVLPHVGLELLAGGGYRHTLKTQGTGAYLRTGKLAEVSQQPLTASVQLFFLPTSYRFQPYVGLGVNYTSFYDERFTRRQRDLGYRRIEADDSVGWAAEVGADFAITKHWMVNAAVWRVDAGTEVTGKNRRTGEKIKFKLDVDPWMYFVGVGYKF